MKKLKQLQNNFTTPKQSKRLLELGVPADSADCYFLSKDGITTWVRGVADKNMNWFGTIDRTPIPCWSAGRLIEIYLMCVDRGTVRPIIPKVTFSNGEMTTIESIIWHIKTDDLDFSKLED